MCTSDQEEVYQDIGYCIKVINNQMKNYFNSTLKACDLTKAQFDTLIFLQHMKERGIIVNQRDLENYFHISNPTVSSLLRRLESKELVSRSTSEGDRRIRYVHITDQAVEQLDQMGTILCQSRNQLFTGLDDEELRQGQRFLRHILENLTGKEELEFDFNLSKTDQTV